MEVDAKNEALENEALLLGDDEGTEQAEFTSGDVELLLGDDDVNAFANESYEAPSSDSKETASKNETEENPQQEGQPIEGHYNRGGRGGRFHRGGRGYGPPPFFPRGLRPPFPGAVPRFGRYPPPHAFRGGRPPMSFMRYPRGIYMRPPRHNIPDEEEPEEEDDKMTGEESSGGPKSLMSIRIQKDVKETVKAQILSKGPLLQAPLGMGMGPRFHLRGPMPGPPRPPPGPGGPEVHQATPNIPPPNSQRGRGAPRGDHHHHHRGSLKRPLSNNYNEGAPRAKVPSFNNVPPPQISTSSRSNLRQIQTVDEPMQTNRSFSQRFSHPPPSLATSPSPKSFTVSHKPAPSLTQIRTVDHSNYSNDNSNLRSIPTVGSSGNHRITKTGGSSNKVMISNLPSTMSFERISAMTTACGIVRNLNVHDNGTAIVEFGNPGIAENFIRTNNRKIIDRSSISVVRLA